MDTFILWNYLVNMHFLYCVGVIHIIHCPRQGREFGVSHASHPRIVEFHGSPIFRIFPVNCGLLAPVLIVKYSLHIPLNNELTYLLTCLLIIEESVY